MLPERNNRTIPQLAPGTWVRLVGEPAGWYRNPAARRDAVVVDHEPGRGVYLQTESSDRALVAESEIRVLKDTPKDKRAFMRHRLPYGMWTCADGREVLFNRNYKLIWERRPGQPVQLASLSERVPFVKEEWFYKDGNTPWSDRDSENRCEDVLRAWGVSEKP